MDAIMDIAESNKFLRILFIQCNCMNRDHIERLCSIVHDHPSLVELSIVSCFHPDVGNADLGDSMLTSLLSGGELRLKSLDLSGNCITSAVGTILADFLASNPPLESLTLRSNQLNDDIVPSIANALRSNNTMRDLSPGSIYNRHDITSIGHAALKSLLFDESSLNAVADSNHTLESFDHSTATYNTRVYNYNSIDSWNKMLNVGLNRGAKIYFLLSKRNRTLANVEHFSDIDVKILPNLLDSVQRYVQRAKLRCKHAPPIYEPVESLSIVYEVMRRWDKVFNLYESRLSKS